MLKIIQVDMKTNKTKTREKIYAERINVNPELREK